MFSGDDAYMLLSSILVQLPSFLTSTKKTTGKPPKNDASDSDNDDMHPTSIAHTPSAPHTQKDANFKLRTKMLTEKLKKTQKPKMDVAASETKVRKY